MSADPFSWRPQSNKPPTPMRRFLRSPYVLIALLIHLAFLLIFGGITVIHALLPKEPFQSTQIYVAAEQNAQPPAPALQPPPPAEETMPVPSATVQNSLSAITRNVLSPDSFSLPSTPSVPTPDVSDLAAKAPTSLQNKHSAQEGFDRRSNGIRDFTRGWGKDGEGPKGTGQATQAQFVCCIAVASGIVPSAYHQLDHDGNIVGGPIPNLLRMLNAWSSGRITASTIPHPLRLDSDEIFTSKPPFIYFAGFSDFVLTDDEVNNLRKYLQVGGALLGDNGLAGEGSPFDIAFRREMKRVIPDADKNFEVLPPDHPIFRGSTSFYQLSRVPPGMNHRAGPIEAIKIDGEISILYTPNDYTDMMCMGFQNPILPNKNIPEKNGIEYFIGFDPNVFWWTGRMFNLSRGHNTFFRNFEPDSCEEVFQLETNIVVYLLTRFEQRLIFTP